MGSLCKMYIPKTLAPNQFKILLRSRKCCEKKMSATENAKRAIWLLMKFLGIKPDLVSDNIKIQSKVPFSAIDLLLAQKTNFSLWRENKPPNGNAKMVLIQYDALNCETMAIYASDMAVMKTRACFKFPLKRDNPIKENA